MNPDIPLIRVTGLMKSPVSWAKVLRELTRSLSRQDDVRVQKNPVRGFLWERDFPWDQTDVADEPDDQPDLELGFTYPPRLPDYVGDSFPYLNLSVYEASRLPGDWVDPMNTYCDCIIVPSSHAETTYSKSGIRDELIEIVPYGYNAERVKRITRSVEESDDPRVLITTIATPHYRKGLDLLEKLSIDVKSDDIEWHIHSPYEPDKEESDYWEDVTVLDRLRRKGFTVTVGTYSDEQILRLLVRSDICVQPSRSEGFGLVVLESMAVGTPVIVPDWGGHLDFEGPGMITVDGTVRPAKNCQYGQKNEDAKVFEPDTRDLQGTIIELIEDEKERNKRAEKSRATVRDWTWARSARKLTELLHDKLDYED